MSRIGKQTVEIIDGVTVDVNGNKFTVKGPLGELKLEMPEYLEVKVEDNKIDISCNDDKKSSRAMYGTFRALLANAIDGVKNGYEKTLEIVGVGYRVKTEGKGVSMTLGWNHPVQIDAPENITFEVPDETTLIVKGFDKQKVGETAAKIRELRKPEPYKGKGIRYKGEYVRRKSPKTVTA